MFSIKAKNRLAGVSSKDLKDSMEIPAVFYGSGKVSTAISIPLNEFKKLWREAGESSTIKITTADGKMVDVIIQEVQTHPVSGEPIHVDFLVVDMNKKLQVSVPLEFIGIAPAVKNGLGVLVKVMRELEIEALPKDLPHNISVDVSGLDSIDSQLMVSDLVLPNGVHAITKESEIVVSIAEQKEEKEETGPVDLSAIEVEKKGKKDEEGSEAEAK